MALLPGIGITAGRGGGWTPKYYVSNTGNDNNSGLSPATAWQTIAKVNGFSFVAGDKIGFKRGDIWNEQLNISHPGSSSGPLIFGAYGSGVNPIISGFSLVTAWTDKGGNIWESTNAVSALSTCNMVTINEVSVPMARSAWMAFQSHSGTSSITTDGLDGTPDWTGAEIVIRNGEFVLDRTVITGQSGGTLTYSPAISWAPTDDYGFFIQNDARLLLTQNDWYYDPSTKKIKIYSVGAPTNVKVSTTDYVVELWKDYLTFQNITFEGANKYLFDDSWSAGNTGTVIKNCSLLNAGIDAIYLSSQSGIVVRDNIITDSNNNGVNLFFNCPNAVIDGNTITNSGISEGMGVNGMYQHQGIAPGYLNTCDGITIKNNKIINSGYCGINFRGDDALVKNNYVDTFCLILNDGGGIYTNNEGGTSSGSVEGNVILNGIGNTNGTSGDIETEAIGLYLDKNSDNIEVFDNSVAHCVGEGIFIHDVSGFNIHDNTVYDCTNQFNIANDEAIGSITDGIVLSNKLIAKEATQNVIRVISGGADVNALLTFPTVAAGFVESPAGTWGSWGYGLDSRVLHGDGWIEAEYSGVTNNNAAIGLSLNNTLNQYPWDFTLVVESTVGNGFESFGLAYGDYSSSGGSPDPTAGDKYRIKRTGDVITAEYYRSSVWTVIRTYTATSSVPLYLKGGLQFGYYLLNPTALTPTYDPVTLMAAFDSNYYARPIDDNLTITVSEDGYTTFTDYTFATWKAYTGQDANSHKSPVAIDNTSKIHFIYNETAISKSFTLSAGMVDVTNESYSGTISLPAFSSLVLIGVGTIS